MEGTPSNLEAYGQYLGVQETAPRTTKTTPPTLSRVPTTNTGFICSRRCRNMCASNSVISELLALIGLTTVTGARLRAWNKEATANP